MSCYIENISDHVPPDSTDWQGHTTGAVYSCLNPHIPRGFFYYRFWSADLPYGPTGPPDPKVLAQQAIASMHLEAGEIGIVPEDKPGYVGTVGFPAWMWIANPSPTTVGPITRTASVDGYTVVARAELVRIDWDMGDGNTVYCWGPGTEYFDGYGKSDSPTCGYTLQNQGYFTVTATSHWEIEWSGIGQSGVIELDLERSTEIVVGELQVLRTVPRSIIPNPTPEN